MLLFTILAFLGAHALRGQIAEEFPNAEAISIRASFREHAHHVGEKVGRARAATAPAATSAGPSTAAELERLAALHDRGSIDDEEYATAKRRVLSAS